MQWWGIPAGAVILAVVELAKRLGLEPRWAGVTAIVIGTLGGLASYLWADSVAATSVMQGLVSGLVAAGLWSTGKATAGR